MMSPEIVLFILRLISSLILLLILGSFFWFLRRDFRATLARLDESRRTYGQLVAMVEADGDYIPTGDSYHLLPLTTLGRSTSNTIPVKDGFASSEHARIILKNGRWWLEDRRSRNGTLLNGLPVTTPVIMTDGDIVGIGELSFRLQLD